MVDWVSGMVLILSPVLTPKAFANFSPRFEHRENPGFLFLIAFNPVRVRLERNPFRVDTKC